MVNVRYAEHTPVPALRPFVQCYWSLVSAGTPHRVLPDGCMDLLFELGDAEARLVGTMTRALMTPPAAPRTSVGVRFHPGGAFCFLGIAANVPRDDTLPIAEVWGALGRELGERVAAAPGVGAALVLIERDLLVRLGGALSPDPRLRAAIAAIRAANGTVLSAQIAERAELGERQLERLFNERVGIGPKAFARVTRMRALVDKLALHEGEPRWADLAARFGYADQGHLIREFRSLAGVTPVEYWRSSISMSEMSNPEDTPSTSFSPACSKKDIET